MWLLEPTSDFELAGAIGNDLWSPGVGGMNRFCGFPTKFQKSWMAFLGSFLHSLLRIKNDASFVDAKFGFDASTDWASQKAAPQTQGPGVASTAARTRPPCCKCPRLWRRVALRFETPAGSLLNHCQGLSVHCHIPR